MFQVFLHAGICWCRWTYIRKLQQHDGAFLPPPPSSLLVSVRDQIDIFANFSRRRLTNWLLNYWATWPVIASYLTSSRVYRILDLAVREEYIQPVSLHRLRSPLVLMTTRNTALIAKSPSVIGQPRPLFMHHTYLSRQYTSARIRDDSNNSLHILCAFLIFSQFILYVTFS